jgi:hypothetical protein
MSCSYQQEVFVKQQPLYASRSHGRDGSAAIADSSIDRSISPATFVLDTLIICFQQARPFFSDCFLPTVSD